MTNRILFGLIAVLVPVGFIFWYLTQSDVTVKEALTTETPVLRIDDIPVRVEIADTDEARIKGLSGRKGLQETTGMFFVFEEAGFHPIWMKDMNFPIDIIWIGEDLTVVGVTENVSPDTYPRTFRSSRPVKYILETNSHFADIVGINEGDAVELPKGYIEK